MFEYDFMVNAFAASGIVAVLAGIVGYFLVMRGQTFAGHALSHVGFTGATGAVLLGVSPIWGMVGFTLAAGVGMGALGERLSGRDVAIGVILSLSLGFGLLFLHFFTAYATQATALLFGNVLGVSHETLVVLAGLATVSLVALGVIMRRCSSLRCSRNWPKPKASRCASSPCCFSRSPRSRWRRARRSSACCSFSR